MNANNKSEPLVVERTLQASASRIWKAMTDNDEIKQWYFQMKEFKPQVGFEFQFTGEKDGVKYLHHCKITEVVLERKLAYSWRYEGYEGHSTVTFELFPEGDRTRVRVTHEGLETFTQFDRSDFMKGWTYIVGEGLKSFAEDRKIVITRVVDAPRERVWEAWTNPEQVAQWWGPKGFTTTIEKMDVRPGGVWQQIMHGPDGTDYPSQSVFIEVVKPERIVYSHGGGKKGGPGVQFESTWTFEAQGQKTKVTIHMIFPTTSVRDQIVKEYGAIEGGHQTLGRLDEYAQGSPA